MKESAHAHFDHVHIQREEIGIHFVAMVRARNTSILDESRFGDGGKGVVVVIEKLVACKIQNRHRKKWLFSKEDSAPLRLIGRPNSACFQQTRKAESCFFKKQVSAIPKA